MAEALTPGAFFSYVRFNDDRDDGRIGQLCEDLSREVQAQTGDPFPIWRDRNDIAWGEQWEERLNRGLAAATFLLVVITPSWFKSPYCRKEFERFLEVEKKRARRDLILPIVYIEAPVLKDEKLRKQDPIAQELARRQLFSFTDLRFEPWTSADVGKRIAQMATAIRDALLRDAPPIPAPKVESASAMPATAKAETAFAAEAKTEAVSAGRTPFSSPAAAPVKTRVVDLFPGRGDHTSISEAIGVAAPGERILVRPGLYREGLVLDKALELIGDGPLAEIVIDTHGKSSLLFKATYGRVANLTFRQTGGENFFCIDIAQGRLDLEDCDLTSQGHSIVGIHGGADPRVRRNRIHDGKSAGVLIHENGKGTLEDNDIFANALSGVAITTGSDPVLRRNRIHDGKKGGVLIHENSKGTLEDNDIFANALAGVAITTGSDPVLRRNRIHDGKKAGVFIYENGKGTLEDNDIFANAFAGVEIKTGADPVLRRNRIHDGTSVGVFIYENGKGALEDNDIYGNALSGVQIQEGADPVLRRNRISQNKDRGIWVYEGGGGTFEKNDLRENENGAWRVDGDSASRVVKRGNIEG